MYDDVITLKEPGAATYDQYGNQTFSYTDHTVYVIPRGVYKSEFYQAGQLGLQPEITFRIANRWDYHEEKLLEYHGEQYEVIRVDWDAQRDAVELVCQKRMAREAEPVTTPIQTLGG